MSNEYDYSTTFDESLESNSKAINDVVSILEAEIRATGEIKRWSKRFSDHIKTIVMNLFHAASIDGTLYVAYSRNKDRYTELRKKNASSLSYDSMVKITDALMKLGYIEGVKGFYVKNNPKKSRAARMKSTIKLSLLGVEYDILPVDIKSQQLNDCIILTMKDGDKKVSLEFEESEETARMRNNLRLINNELQKHFIGLDVSDDTLTEIKNATKGIIVEDYDAYEDYYVDVESLEYAVEEKKKVGREHFRSPLNMDKNTLVRIFCNGSFEQGGRFYRGWWQAVPSKYRAFIAIDDKPTIEIDYSGIHINLLYIREGLPIPTDDVYTMDYFPEEIRDTVRDVMKIALQILLNSKYEAKALWSIKKHKEINKYINLFKTYSHEEIVEAFKEKHKAIEKYFFSGIGVFLQYEDSVIAEDVLCSLVSKGIIALPIHDSFIVLREHESILRSAMNEAVNKRYGQELKLKADKLAFESVREFLEWNMSAEDRPLSDEEYLADGPSRNRKDYLSRRDLWYSERNL